MVRPPTVKRNGPRLGPPRSPGAVSMERGRRGGEGAQRGRGGAPAVLAQPGRLRAPLVAPWGSIMVPSRSERRSPWDPPSAPFGSPWSAGWGRPHKTPLSLTRAREYVKAVPPHYFIPFETWPSGVRLLQAIRFSRQIPVQLRARRHFRQTGYPPHRHSLLGSPPRGAAHTKAVSYARTRAST